MSEWRVIFATVIIFGAGVISGGLLVNYADVSHLKALPAVSAAVETNNASLSVSGNVVKKPGASNKLRLPEILTKQFVDRLKLELKLTVDQQATIEKIIADSQDEMRMVVQSVRQDARQKIREQLKGEQKRRFDDLFKLRHDGKKGSSGTNAPAANSSEVIPTNSLPAD